MSVEDLVVGLAELNEYYEDYDSAEAYFEGETEEVFATPHLRRRLVEMGSAYRTNLARIPVTTVADLLEIANVSVPDDASATAKIQDIRRANNMKLLEPEINLKALEYGDAYAMVWPIEPEYDVVDPELAEVALEITYHSPKCMRVIYDEEHPTRKAFAINKWYEGKRWRVDLIYRDVIESWISKGEKLSTEASSWEHYFDPEAVGETMEVETSGEWPLDNPFGEIPVFHFRTAMQYGRPEHKDAYAPQDAINKLIITQLTTTEEQGWPYRYRLIDAAAVLDQNNDDPDWEDDADAHTGSTIDDESNFGDSVNHGPNRINYRGGGVSTSARTAPGTMQDMTGVTEVGQLAAADPNTFIQPIEMYIGLMAEITSTPFKEFKVGGVQPSEGSQREAREGLKNKVKNRKLYFGTTWEELWKFALSVVGVSVDVVDVRWVPYAATDDKAFWEVAKVKQQVGVPNEQILLEAGYQPEQISAWGITQEVKVNTEEGA